MIIGKKTEAHFNSPNSYASLVRQQCENGFYDKFNSYMFDGVVLDIGANIGLFSMMASKIAKKVYSVEPTKSHIEVFEEIMQLNNISNVELIPKALTKEACKIPFYQCTINSTMNSVFQYGPNSFSEYEVEGVPLNSIIKKTNEISFMKLDIEGSEKFLLNCDYFLDSLKQVKSIFIEIHEVDGKSFDILHNEWAVRLSKVYSNITRIGIDGIFCH